MQIESATMRSMIFNIYQDKVLGGLIGNHLGSRIVAPIHKDQNNPVRLEDLEFTLQHTIGSLEFKMLWLDLAKKKGPYVREHDFGDQWKNHCTLYEREHGIAARNLNLGLYPPDSGSHNNEYWGEGMGSIIRAEVWGQLNPGMPAQAAYFAGMDASLDHDGFSVDASRFISAMTAIAFFESDIREIIDGASSIFEHQCPFIDVLEFSLELHDSCEFEIALCKMKSRYGDFNFHNAPINIGLLLLALLEYEPNIDSLINISGLGRNSTGIAGIAGSIYGIIDGASAIPGKWQKRVDNNIHQNGAITAIRTCETLTEFAQEICNVGFGFVNYFSRIELTDAPQHMIQFLAPKFNINTLLQNYQPSLLVDNQIMQIEYENMTAEPQQVILHFSSPDLEFHDSTIELKVDDLSIKSKKTKFKLSPAGYENIVAASPESIKPSIRYKINISINGVEQQPLERGLLFYGTWLMFGPFITEIESSSLDNNNHNEIDYDTEHLTIDEVRGICEKKNFEDHPFEIQPINPDGFKIKPTEYFDGRGERTIYLYTKLHSIEAKDVQLAIGCSSSLKIWWNGEVVFSRKKIRRTWPTDIAIQATLQKGENDLLVRLDSLLDNIEFECGIKSFDIKLNQPSNWDVMLTPYV
jgi:hypothetical protein